MNQKSIPASATIDLRLQTLDRPSSDRGLSAIRRKSCPPPTTARAPKHWECLFHQTLLFAHYQVQRLRWRGVDGGIMPDGYDANSLAAEAFLDFFIAEKLKSNANRSLNEILYELKRLVLKHVTRLHHRRENFILSNAEDLAPMQIEDEFLNPIHLIPDDPVHHPDAILLDKEAIASFESAKSQFSAFLNGKPRLRTFFHTLCDNVEKPRDLAGKLKLRRARVTNLRKQLRRRWRDCFGSRSLPDSV